MGAVTGIRTPGQQKAAFLSQMSDAQVTCRGAHRHRWPSDELSSKMKRVPRQMQVQAQREGGFEITEECMRDCGRMRRYITLSGGLFDLDTRYSYWSKKGTDWVTIPQDSDVDMTARDYKAELFERNAQLIRASARPAAAS